MNYSWKLLQNNGLNWKWLLRGCINSAIFFIKGREIIFIIFTHKVDEQSVPEVEFSCENADAKRVPGTVENEYTISVTAPGKYLQQDLILDFSLQGWSNITTFFSTRYACWRGITHYVHWPIMYQFAACYILYKHGRSQSVSWKCDGSH